MQLIEIQGEKFLKFARYNSFHLAHMKVHLGTEISKVQKIRGLSNEELAEKIHTSYRNVTKIKTKEDMAVSQLYDISEALDYNFFQLLEPVVIEPKNVLEDGMKEYKKFKESDKKLTVKFEVQYPVSEASELGKFMMHVNSIAEKMGFEIL